MHVAKPFLLKGFRECASEGIDTYWLKAVSNYNSPKNGLNFDCWPGDATTALTVHLVELSQTNHLFIVRHPMLCYTPLKCLNAIISNNRNKTFLSFFHPIHYSSRKSVRIIPPLASGVGGKLPFWNTPINSGGGHG